LVTPRVIDTTRSEKQHVQLDVNLIRLKAADAKRVWPEAERSPGDAANSRPLKAVVQRHDGALSLAELRKKGLANVVFKQRLITLSGHTADIVSGGQMPVLAGEESGSRFSLVPVGTMLKLMPYVVDKDRVRLAIDLAVTKVDNSTGTLDPASQGTVRNPRLDTRNAKTVVELLEGQMLALGGFLENDEESIILITPRLVDPEAPPPAPSILRKMAER
jgi:Flp pilus assembly secretin CpaC